MGKKLPFILLLAGLWLLLYPGVCQQLTDIVQHHAIAADKDVIGTLTIPSLELSLPIRDGTSEAVLYSGVGLLEDTQLGEHAVLCGHRGLPEARLFTDLDKLQSGDLFSVTTTEGTVTYQVEQILVVSPDDTEALLPEPGRTLCTLLTCTPYGINSHRLLVRGCAVDKNP